MAFAVLKLWKPYDVLSAFTDGAEDGPSRATLAEFVQRDDVYSAGRLDKDSEGLLLLSTSAEVRAYLTAPNKNVAKSYYVQVEGIPDDAAIASLRTGIELADGATLPAKVTLMGGPPELPDRSVPIRHRESVPTSWLRMTIKEGRNRQVRRMTAAVGHPTLRLVRWSVGPINLGGLSPGQCHELDRDELTTLLPRRIYNPR